MPNSRPFRFGLQCASAAAYTTSLGVGALVLGHDYQHPVTLARELSTIDLLSDGRLEIGVGAGWMTVDYEKAGLTLDRPGVRIDRLAESVAILKGLMADGPFTFSGEHYRVTELQVLTGFVHFTDDRQSMGGSRVRAGGRRAGRHLTPGVPGGERHLQAVSRCRRFRSPGSSR